MSDQPYIYTPTGWDSAWKAAKATIGAQRVRIVGIGDSITAGQNSTDIMIDTWWAKVRASLLATYSSELCGDYYSMLYSSVYGLFTASPPIVKFGSDATANMCGFNQGLFTGIVNVSPFLSCTPPYAVVGFDIFFIDFATGSWTYNIDGGSNTTVNTTGPGTAAGSIVKKVSITGLTPGTHTLNINASAGVANCCNILGFAAYKSTTGLCFANLGWVGMGLVTGQSANNALSDTAKFPPDRLALTGQGYMGTTAAPTALSGLDFPTQPDLAIIALGVNDANQSVTRANYRDALERLVYSLRYGKNDACSIIIVAMYTGDGTLTTATSVANQDYTASAVSAYRDIKAAMIEVAQANTCAFVDVHGSFGRQAVTNGWVHSASDIHPTVAGYAKIASMITSII